MSIAIKASTRGRMHHEAQQLHDKLFKDLGKITREDQVAAAYRFESKLIKDAPRDEHKTRAWEALLRDKIDRQRAVAEIALYSLTGHSSSWYIPEQSGANILDEDGVLELNRFAVAWVRLVVEDRLKDYAPDIVAFQKGKSPSRGIKKFMVEYKRKKGFALWDHKNIAGMRREICAAVVAATSGKRTFEDFSAGQETTPPPSNPAPRENTTTQGTQTVEPEPAPQTATVSENTRTKLEPDAGAEIELASFSADRLASPPPGVEESEFKKQRRLDLKLIKSLKETVDQKREASEAAREVIHKIIAEKNGFPWAELIHHEVISMIIVESPGKDLEDIRGQLKALGGIEDVDALLETMMPFIEDAKAEKEFDEAKLAQKNMMQIRNNEKQRRTLDDIITKKRAALEAARLKTAPSSSDEVPLFIQPHQDAIMDVVLGCADDDYATIRKKFSEIEGVQDVTAIFAYCKADIDEVKAEKELEDAEKARRKWKEI